MRIGNGGVTSKALPAHQLAGVCKHDAPYSSRRAPRRTRAKTVLVREGARLGALGAGENVARRGDHPVHLQIIRPSKSWGGEVNGEGSETRAREERVNRLVLKFMEHGLIWAILVWASAVALMAIHTPDPFWRWSFFALSATGVVTVAARDSKDGSES
ncbi:MAG: hypothetical protein C4293_12320 [Nitrospiraceae bacterium]